MAYRQTSTDSHGGRSTPGLENLLEFCLRMQALRGVAERISHPETAVFPVQAERCMRWTQTAPSTSRTVQRSDLPQTILSALRL